MTYRTYWPSGANAQPHISKNATEKRVARTVAYSRSGMVGYELHDHLSQQLLRPIGGYFANSYSSVGSISEETGIGKLTLLDLEIRVSRFMPLPYSTLQTHSS